MIWARMTACAKELVCGRPQEARVSRRDVLTGLGLIGAVAFAAPALLAPGKAEADAIADRWWDSESPEAEPEIQLAWGHDRRPRGRRRRRERMSAREVRRRCREDRRFRRRNWDLCRQVARRRRRGTCIQIGPFQICE
jgi:hypothetical protein